MLVAPPAAARGAYLAGFLVTVVATWLLRDYGGGALVRVSPIGAACAKAQAPAACAGASAALRIGFANWSERGERREVSAPATDAWPTLPPLFFPPAGSGSPPTRSPCSA